MEDSWKKKVEHGMNTLNRRISDHSDLLAKDRADIDMLHEILKENQKTNELIEQVVEYAKKTYEVFEPLAKFMGNVAKIGLLFTFLWHGIKWAAIKAGVVL